MSNSIFDNKFDNIYLIDFLDLLILSFWKIYELIFKEMVLCLNLDFIHKY